MKCQICKKELEKTSEFPVKAPFGKIVGKVYECCERQFIEQNLVKEERGL